MPNAATDVPSIISANSGMILTFRRLCASDVKRLGRMFCRSGIRQGVKILPDQPDRSAVAALDWRRSRQADEKLLELSRRHPISTEHHGNISHVPGAAHRESSLPAPTVPADRECAVACRRGRNRRPDDLGLSGSVPLPPMCWPSPRLARFSRARCATSSAGNLKRSTDARPPTADRDQSAS
jgi:hypothetical protein